VTAVADTSGCVARIEETYSSALDEREFGDFDLSTRTSITSCLMGSRARDVHGKELELALPDSDSGIYIRGAARHQCSSRTF